MAVIFRDDFDGSGGIDGRVTMGYTWEGSGSTNLTGGTLTLTGSALIDLLDVLESAEYVDVTVGFTVPSWAGLEVTLAQNAGAASTDIGTGFRYDYRGQYDGTLQYSACGAVTSEAGPGTDITKVLRFRISSASNAMEIYEDDVLVESAVTAGSVPFGTLSNMKLRLGGTYDPPFDFVEVSVPDAPPGPSGPFWTAFTGTREIE